MLNQVASKVYDMIAFGKPILNFYQNENDISLEHMSKYPLCKSMPYVVAQKTVDEICKFCKENKGKLNDQGYSYFNVNGDGNVGW